MTPDTAGSVLYIASLNLEPEDETETDDLDSVNEMVAPKRGRRRAS
jgi:hypothetical protein